MKLLVEILLTLILAALFGGGIALAFIVGTLVEEVLVWRLAPGS